MSGWAYQTCEICSLLLNLHFFSFLKSMARKGTKWRVGEQPGGSHGSGNLSLKMDMEMIMEYALSDHRGWTMSRAIQKSTRLQRREECSGNLLFHSFSCCQMNALTAQEHIEREEAGAECFRRKQQHRPQGSRAECSQVSVREGVQERFDVLHLQERTWRKR